MNILKPLPPPYDPLEWKQKPLAEKSRMVCEAWALQGYGAPLGVLFVYFLKVLGYIYGWIFFCSLSPSLGGISTIENWWMEPVAFQKAIVWSMFFEGLGLGCGSGPLTGRYFPPLGGFLYFLRPGTTKLPLFPRLLGTKRNALDVLLYAGHNIYLVYLLSRPELSAQMFLPAIAALGVLGVFDKTIFLASRAEHYFTSLVCFAFAGDWIAGSKAVHLALWFFAGVSKLNHHFPAVVCVMTSNSPLTNFAWLRKMMYRNYPADLRPSRLAVWLAHGGGLLEFLVPLVLGLSTGGTATELGLVLMLLLHIFITSNVPMGVPIEWNFMMVYGGFFLFWENAGVSVLGISSPLLFIFLVVMLVVVPIAGNVAPKWVSFLMSMRYYAGNWAFSAWMFRAESYRRLDKNLKKSSGWVYDQVARFYDYPTSVGLIGKVFGFRSMHLHGRVLPRLLPRAVERVEDYEHVDGEVVAGMVLGWNFGDGHLHREELLRAVQAQCRFEPGELRCVFVESQPMFSKTVNYRIYDACSGLIEEGEIAVSELLAVQPWAVS